MYNGSGFGSTFDRSSISRNEGLRKYMLNIYNYMSVALLISALVSLIALRSGVALLLASSPLIMFLVALSPLFMSMYMATRFNKMSVNGAIGFLCAFAGVMGLSLSMIFLVFTASQVASAFFITASMFLSASIYGYITKKDLSPIGRALFMMIIGLLIASVVNMFMRSGGFDFLISCSFVVIFSVMTAYDTQRLKNVYYALGSNNETAQKVAVFGALQLYMDFINIFISMLHIIRGMDSRGQ